MGRPGVISVDASEVHENTHVHEIYDRIAQHFSATRYKPWPIVAQFLSSLPTGSIGLDSGTGNGKYLPLPVDRPGSLCTIGLDRSRNLLDIARRAGESGIIRDVVWGDVLGHGWRSGIFDYAISIATIHHLSTHERRKKAVQRLLQCVSPTHGRILIFVWAVEQDQFSKRSIPSSGQKDSTVNNFGQDVFVPWVLSKEHQENNLHVEDQTSLKRSDSSEATVPQVFHRYYHLFAEGELVGLVRGAVEELGLEIGSPSVDHTGKRGVKVVQEGWERSNYFVELECWEC